MPGAVRCWTGGADEESVGVRAQANTGHGIGGGGPPVIRYLVMRLLGVVAVVWIIGSVTFALMHAVPGGPWDESKGQLPAETKELIRHKYGLDRPLEVQYVEYWSNVIRGDLGIP